MSTVEYSTVVISINNTYTESLSISCSSAESSSLEDSHEPTHVHTYTLSRTLSRTSTGLDWDSPQLKPMERLDTAFVLARLQTDGLSGLSRVLQQAVPPVILAGSYTVPWYTEVEEHVPDIDLWIPFHSNVESTVLSVTAFLYTHGYRLPTVAYSTKPPPPRHAPRGRPPVPRAYQRMQNIMSTLYCFVGREDATKRKVQLMLLNANGGTTAEDIIQHFDLTLVQRYFDGSHLWSTPGSTRAVTLKTLDLNTESKMIREQSFPEWVRTLSRLTKYSQRGYTVGDRVSPFLVSIVTACLARECTIEMFVQTYELSGPSHRLSLESYLHHWNILVPQLTWGPHTYGPTITLTVRPPGNTLNDVHICLVCTGPSMTDTLSWSDLPPQTHCPRLTVTSANRDARTIRWHEQTHLVSALTPFPCLRTDPAPEPFRPDRTARVYDHIHLEERHVQEFIEEAPGDHFIVYGHTSVPHTMTRHQLTTAKVYLPCRRKNSADHGGLEVLHKAIVTIAIPEGSFFVPCLQVDELLCQPGTCRVQLTASSVVWDCSIVYIHSPHDREEAQNFVGGNANNGGPFSAKHVHFLQRLA